MKRPQRGLSPEPEALPRRVRYTFIGMALGVGLAASGILFAALCLVFKGLWALLAARLMPGAVDAGLVAESMDWGTAALLALPFVILLGAYGEVRRRLATSFEA